MRSNKCICIKCANKLNCDECKFCKEAVGKCNAPTVKCPEFVPKEKEDGHS